MSIFAIVLLSTVSAYSLCNSATYPFSGQVVSVPLVPTSTVFLEVNGVSTPILISGNVNVVDGCTFSVSNFTLSTTAGLSWNWYGAIAGSTLPAIHLSATAITPSLTATTQSFTFVTEAGDGVSYADFNVFEVFELSTKSIIATANLPTGQTGSGHGTTGSPNSSVASASATASSIVGGTSTKSAGGSASSTPAASSSSESAFLSFGSVLSAVVFSML